MGFLMVWSPLVMRTAWPYSASGAHTTVGSPVDPGGHGGASYLYTRERPWNPQTGTPLFASRVPPFGLQRDSLHRVAGKRDRHGAPYLPQSGACPRMRLQLQPRSSPEREILSRCRTVSTHGPCSPWETCSRRPPPPPSPRHQPMPPGLTLRPPLPGPGLAALTATPSGPAATTTLTLPGIQAPVEIIRDR